MIFLAIHPGYWDTSSFLPFSFINKTFPSSSFFLLLFLLFFFQHHSENVVCENPKQSTVSEIFKWPIWHQQSSHSHIFPLLRFHVNSNVTCIFIPVALCPHDFVHVVTATWLCVYVCLRLITLFLNHWFYKPNISLISSNSNISKKLSRWSKTLHTNPFCNSYTTSLFAQH